MAASSRKERKRNDGGDVYVEGWYFKHKQLGQLGDGEIGPHLN